MLPKISHPTFTFVRPSNDEKIKFRPFTTKEEKLLLMAKQGESVLNIYETVLQIVNNCVVEPANTDVTKWATFDVELLYVRIRAKSIGEEVDVTYTPEDGKKFDASINLEDAYVTITDEMKKKKYRTVMLNDEVGVLLRWPHFTQLAEFAYYCKALADGEIEATAEDAMNRSFTFFAECIEAVFEGDTVVSEFTKEEIVQFVADMPSDKYVKLQGFVDRVPSLRYKGKYLTEKGSFEDFEVAGFVNFFTF
jgi:hypothetical protein